MHHHHSADAPGLREAGIPRSERKAPRPTLIDRGARCMVLSPGPLLDQLPVDDEFPEVERAGKIVRRIGIFIGVFDAGHVADHERPPNRNVLRLSADLHIPPRSTRTTVRFEVPNAGPDEEDMAAVGGAVMNFGKEAVLGVVVDRILIWAAGIRHIADGTSF